MIDLEKLRKSKGHVLAIVDTKTGEYEPLNDDVVILHSEDIHFVSKKAEELYYGSLACESCSNNPKNGGTGICHCILGNPIIY